jgi:integrase
VRLLAPLRDDLVAWRADKPAIELIFPTRRGIAWDEDDWRNWRDRVYRPAAEAADLTGTRPYDLRHSAASLWLHEGRTIIRGRDVDGSQRADGAVHVPARDE